MKGIKPALVLLCLFGLAPLSQPVFAQSNCSGRCFFDFQSECPVYCGLSAFGHALCWGYSCYVCDEWQCYGAVAPEDAVQASLPTPGGESESIALSVVELPGRH
jgi:hypothetical protein